MWQQATHYMIIYNSWFSILRLAEMNNFFTLEHLLTPQFSLGAYQVYPGFFLRYTWPALERNTVTEWYFHEVPRTFIRNLCQPHEKDFWSGKGHVDFSEVHFSSATHDPNAKSNVETLLKNVSLFTQHRRHVVAEELLQLYWHFSSVPISYTRSNQINFLGNSFIQLQYSKRVRSSDTLSNA